MGVSTSRYRQIYWGYEIYKILRHTNEFWFVLWPCFGLKHIHWLWNCWCETVQRWSPGLIDDRLVRVSWVDGWRWWPLQGLWCLASTFFKQCLFTAKKQYLWYKQHLITETKLSLDLINSSSWLNLRFRFWILDTFTLQGIHIFYLGRRDFFFDSKVPFDVTKTS